MNGMEWKLNNRKYSSGSLLLLGEWEVGAIYYDIGKSTDDILKYCATCKLPGIKSNFGHFETIDEAKSRVEKAVLYWLSKLPNYSKGEINERSC